MRSKLAKLGLEGTLDRKVGFWTENGTVVLLESDSDSSIAKRQKA